MSSGFHVRKASPPRSAEACYRERRRRRDQRRGDHGWPIRIGQIADRDHLYHCFQVLRREGGPAPGVDGITYADLTPREAGEICGDLSKIVLAGTYRPQPVRTVPIPKPGTSDYRRLKIGTIVDRVVGKALDDGFKQFWEKRFLPGSYGFRPKRNTWRLLADLEVAARRTGHACLVIEDLKAAFDSVPVAEVVACHRRALARVRRTNFAADDKARTLALVERVLRGHDLQRERGIDQGGPYSPCALNVLLHQHHDLPLSHEIPSSLLWFRYADNLAYLVPSMSEGEQTLNRVAGLLRPLGLTLKGDGDAGVKDLHGGDEIQLLGFALTWSGKDVKLSPGKDSFNHLGRRLNDAHVAPNPPAIARAVIRGWVEALGPAFENGTVADVFDIAAENGFWELPSLEVVEARWRSAWERWQECRKRACRRDRGTG